LEQAKRKNLFRCFLLELLEEKGEEGRVFLLAWVTGKKGIRPFFLRKMSYNKGKGRGGKSPGLTRLTRMGERDFTLLI